MLRRDRLQDPCLRLDQLHAATHRHSRAIRRLHQTSLLIDQYKRSDRCIDAWRRLADRSEERRHTEDNQGPLRISQWYQGSGGQAGRWYQWASTALDTLSDRWWWQSVPCIWWYDSSRSFPVIEISTKRGVQLLIKNHSLINHNQNYSFKKWLCFIKKN